MRAFAFIPARGGSKRVPGKNLAEVGGVSLLDRAIEAALYGLPRPSTEPRIWVSTDDAEIDEAARGWNDDVVDVLVHERPPQLATDHAQIEAAIAHWWTRLDDKPDAIVLLQPTSPFRTAAHVREALRLMEATGADSVVGVTLGHEHHFAGRLKPREVPSVHAAYLAATGQARSWYDFAPFRDVTAARPRTQDLRPMGAENGSVYVTRRAAFEATGLRMSGHMVALPMTRVEGWDVDTQEDIDVCNALVAAGVCK